jgi:HAMP domain-containing protein
MARQRRFPAKLLSVAVSVAFAAISVFGIIVSWWVTRQITRPVKHNLQLAELIASGDLSSDIRPQGEDELGKLTGAMGRMNDKLRAMIGEVRSSVAQVSLAATEIAEGNTDLSSRTEQQAAAVVQTAASMEELTATVKNNADNARHASQLAAEASQTATQGGRVMRDVVSTMSDINTSSQKIADITAVINSIAFCCQQVGVTRFHAAVTAHVQVPAFLSGDDTHVFTLRFCTFAGTARDAKLHFVRRTDAFVAVFQLNAEAHAIAHAVAAPGAAYAGFRLKRYWAELALNAKIAQKACHGSRKRGYGHTRSIQRSSAIAHHHTAQPGELIQFPQRAFQFVS